MLLYVHRNRRFIRDGSSVQVDSSRALDVHRKHKAYYGRREGGGGMVVGGGGGREIERLYIFNV